MKRFFPIWIVGLAAFAPATAQHVSQRSALGPMASDRVNILKASLALRESQEQLFWPLYEQYEQKLSAFKETSFESLRRLSESGVAGQNSEGIQDFFKDQSAEASLKREYFNKILASTNGTIALQFLQGEALYDLIKRSQLYEEMEWSYPTWNPAIIHDEKLKVNLLEYFLNVPTQDSALFRRLTHDFEFEFSRVVGHEYVFFEQYIDDPGEWTPGQCKKLGNAFLGMQANEVKVKARYFHKIADSFGSDFAARFMAVQEYFNTMSKLRIWNDYLSDSMQIQR